MECWTVIVTKIFKETSMSLRKIKDFVTESFKENNLSKTDMFLHQDISDDLFEKCMKVIR